MIQELITFFEQRGYQVERRDDLVMDSLDITKYTAILLKKDGFSSTFTFSLDISRDGMKEAADWFEERLKRKMEQS